MWSPSRTLLFVVVALALVASCNALVHRLRVQHDARRSFVIEGFGYSKGGQYVLRTSKFKFTGTFSPEDSPPSTRKIGFLLFKQSRGTNELDGTALDIDCSQFTPTFPLYKNATPFRYTITEDGYYSTSFVNCEPTIQTVGFHMNLRQFNVEGNTRHFLSVGQMPLRAIFLLFSFMYLAMFVFWLMIVFRAKRDSINGRVYFIHLLMAVVIFFKFASIFLHAIDFYHLDTTGHGGALEWFYEILTFFKATTMFAVILLIGSGWSFLKPFLSDRDRILFLIFIPLQVLANIALVVVDETNPGSLGWLEWHEIFRLVDLVCCFALLAPVMWSIQQLKEGATTDGKARRSLEKLKLFRQFYLLVIVYVYCTRVFMYMLASLLSYKHIWVPEFLSEVMTVVFYTVTGVLFRPKADNPYLHTKTDDEDEDSSRSIALQRLAEDDD